MITRILAIGACLALSGCAGVGGAGFRTVEAGMTVNVGNNVTVDPQIVWANPYGPGISTTVWTIDGFGLNDLRFLMGIKPGTPLARVSGVEPSEVGTYAATMLPNDVMELLSSTLGKAGFQQIRTDRLRPAQFGADQGFRFDLNYSRKNGLRMKAMVLAAQRGEALDLIMFSAPAEYYFDRYAPTVEQVFASVRTTAPVQARAS
jgi:hypothetical protein